MSFSTPFLFNTGDNILVRAIHLSYLLQTTQNVEDVKDQKTQFCSKI